MLNLRNISIFYGIGRRILLWFSLFFLIPLLTVSFTGYQQSKKAIRKQVYDHFESMLDLQKEALIHYLEQKKVQLKSSVAENEFIFISTVVLQSATFGKGDIEAARNRVQKYAAEKKIEMAAREIWILGKNGGVLASSDASMLDSDRRLSPEFIAYQADPAPIKIRYMETSHGPEVLIFAPIKSEIGEWAGLFTLSINIEDIYRILENRTGLGETGETYLVDDKGRMISRSRFLPDVILKKKIRLAEILERKDWRISENYPLNYRGLKVIQAHARSPYFGWTLIGEMETSEAFRDLTAQRNKTIMIAIVLFILLVLVAALISETLTRPIRVLAQAAKRVSKGDLNQKVETQPGNELADLALEFNKMTKSLKESKEKMEEWNAGIQQEVENRTQDLLKSELKFRNLMENANDAIMIFNAEDRLCSLANLKAEILTGYRHEEILRTRFFDFFPPDHSERLKEHYRKALERGSDNLYNIPLQRKDGWLVFVDISNSLIEFQNQKFINCILHDVTEKHKIERERNAVFQISDIIAKSSDLDTILRKALDIILKNLELEVAVIFLYDQKTNELILSFQKGFSKAFMDQFARQAVTADSGRICVKTAFTQEMHYLQNPFEGNMDIYLDTDVDKDYLQTVVSLPLLAEGTLVGVLEVITNRRRRFSSENFMLLEALANQLAAGILRIQLEQGMQERIQQSEKLSSVGQLAAGIAHEIGTPLNIISGNAEYLMMDMKPDDPKMEELSIIIQQTERIAKLIQQLMDFARNTRPSFELTDIHQLIDNTLTLTRHQIKKHFISLTSNLNGRLPKIVADPNQIQQVFLNIIINAIQATPDGGSLRIETEIGRDEESVQVRICDTGCGIPREYINNIFDPFFTTKEVGQGTGLGLAVSHRIIENHRGKIEVESRVNEGTCFTVILPIHAEETRNE